MTCSSIGFSHSCDFLLQESLRKLEERERKGKREGKSREEVDTSFLGVSSQMVQKVNRKKVIKKLLSTADRDTENWIVFER